MFLAKITAKLVIVVVFFDITKQSLMPNLSLLLWVCLLMVADVITGLLKSKLLRQEITSGRLRASIIKFLQYFGCIGLTIVIKSQPNVGVQIKSAMTWAQDGLTILIIYIECLSIFENLYAMDRKNPFAVYVIRPIYFLLSLAVKNNMFTEAEKEQKKKTPAEDDDFGNVNAHP